MMLKKRGRTSGIPAGIFAGVITALLITILLAAVTAVLIAGEKIGEDKALFGSAASLLLGAAFGGICAANVAGERKMIICLIHGAVYYVTLLCVTAVFFEGRYENIWITGLLVLGASISVGLLVMRGRKRTYKPHKIR
jgi:putative membrane protein (TIGR04086 family)